MLVYEKKVNTEKHLFGTTENIPAAADQKLLYTDKYGAPVTPSFTDKFFDDKAGGISWVAPEEDPEFMAVFIAGEQEAIIPKGWQPGTILTGVSIDLKTEPTKTSYQSSETGYTDKMDWAGCEITVTLYATGGGEYSFDLPWDSPYVTLNPEQGHLFKQSEQGTVNASIALNWLGQAEATTGTTITVVGPLLGEAGIVMFAAGPSAESHSILLHQPYDTPLTITKVSGDNICSSVDEDTEHHWVTFTGAEDRHGGMHALYTVTEPADGALGLQRTAEIEVHCY